MEFEWDEFKGLENHRKHGVSFEEARGVFLDDYARLIPDPDHSLGEERFILLGVSTQGRLLVVCHSEPVKDSIRIISARRADPYERKQYEGFRNA